MLVGGLDRGLRRRNGEDRRPQIGKRARRRLDIDRQLRAMLAVNVQSLLRIKGAPNGRLLGIRRHDGRNAMRAEVINHVGHHQA
ncbi:hypothetical protein ACFFWD_41590 [Bradyrhizobium erythrophlei]|uniref:hypothetical protein n=1 Tax=Bradyrhizobium erythrophlei TaxID=1437360 RepID=UPI0035ED5B4C